MPNKEVSGATVRAGAWRIFSASFVLFLLFQGSQLTAAEEKGKKDGAATAFATTEIRLEVEPDKESFKAEWEYTNPHELPMVVEHIDSSCGCLAAQASEYQHVRQGESGVIAAEFKPGNHRGVLRKSLHVRFVGYDKPVELVVEAHIPSPVELSTQELTWTTENKDKPQVVEITTGTDEPFTITGLNGVPDRLFTIEKETLSEKRHYRLHITPTGEPAPGIQTLQVRTDSRDPRDQVIAIFLRSPQA